MDRLPYDVLEAMVQCFGKCFYYREPMAQFLLSAGVPRRYVEKDKSQAKFVWARQLLSELGESEEGRLLQRRVLTALCKLRKLPDAGVQSKEAGLEALRELKQLAVQYELEKSEQAEQASSRNSRATEAANEATRRIESLARLHQDFSAAVIGTNRQRAGYSLEDLLVDLFALFEIDYRKSYRTPTQQIDGCFRFEGFDYLVEARWRSDQPTEQEIGGFKHKVDGKLQSTRGIFVSIPGFRQEVASQFDSRGGNIILLDGQHITHVLEHRRTLPDLLRRIIDKAAQEGVCYCSDV